MVLLFPRFNVFLIKTQEYKKFCSFQLQPNKVFLMSCFLSIGLIDKVNLSYILLYIFYLSIYILSVCLFVYQPVFLSAYQSVWLSFYLSIYYLWTMNNNFLGRRNISCNQDRSIHLHSREGIID